MQRFKPILILLGIAGVEFFGNPYLDAESTLMGPYGKILEMNPSATESMPL